MNIVQHNFPENQYYRVETTKKAICLHHTVSGEGVIGDINWWEKTPERVATHYIISRDGTVHQMFSEKHWGHHLGIRSANNTVLNQQTIGIELDSWGWLKKEGNVFKTCYGQVFSGEVQEYPSLFRGYQFYEKYTSAQLRSMLQLVIGICARHNIPKIYHKDMWGISNGALKGESGIWSHVSFRSDKSDCHPQPELITQLHSLILTGSL